jgi:predicted negative regulator of RcsB-dependent stress response
LRQVVANSSDEELGHIAQLRLARLLIQTGKHDEALKELDVEKAGAFAAQVREIRGDALLAKGDAQGARAEYAAALAGDTKGEIDRATVELKLRDVGGDVPAPKPVTAPAAKGDS